MIENFACSLEWEGIENFKRFLNRKIETDDEILIEINSVQRELYFPDSVNDIFKKYWIFISKFRTYYIILIILIALFVTIIGELKLYGLNLIIFCILKV